MCFMCLLLGVFVMCVGVCEGVLYYLYVCITFVIISAFVVNKEIYKAMNGELRRRWHLTVNICHW